MKITRTFSTENFRAMCIRHQFCNRASCAEYEALFQWIENRAGNATDDAICELAVKVADLTMLADFPDNTIDERKELIAHIGFTICRECVLSWIEF